MVKKRATRVTKKKIGAKKAGLRKVATKGGLQASAGFTELLGRALTDTEFRDELFRDRSKVVRRFRLSKADLATLDSLTKRQLEEQAGRLGGRAAITIKVVISKSF